MKKILGTMTFGQQTDETEAKKIVEVFLRDGNEELDTAYVYNEGRSEQILGKAIEYDLDKVKVATKANPRITGRLDADAVNMQFKEPLERMQVNNVDIYYLHFPDYNTPVDSALEACAKLYEEGKFKQLGLSNFPAWMVAEIYHKCKTNGYMLPKIYEGVYNALSRDAERELLDALNEYDISFYAYNPLAGGILSGKYNSYDDKPIEGRFTFRPNYQNRYWKKSYFEALDIIRPACEKEEIPMAEAAFRWIANHSELSKNNNNGIIIGASSSVQLEKNINAINRGKLADEIVDAFDKGWNICKKDAPVYFRYYGK